MSITIAPARDNAAGLIVSTGQIARRVLLKFVRSPQLVVLGTVQGALFLLIFRYVFGGAITTPGIDYVDFVVPGFITTGVLFNAMYASAGMAEDMSAGAEAFSAMDASETPGTRASVDMTEVKLERDLSRPQ